MRGNKKKKGKKDGKSGDDFFFEFREDTRPAPMFITPCFIQPCFHHVFFSFPCQRLLSLFFFFFFSVTPSRLSCQFSEPRHWRPGPTRKKSAMTHRLGCVASHILCVPPLLRHIRREGACGWGVWLGSWSLFIFLLFGMWASAG